MGMDIHMYIVQDGKTIKKNVFDGRNTDWFLNLMKRYDNEYIYFPSKSGLSPQSSKEVIDEYKKDEDSWFGLNYINIFEFMEWFEKYRPDLEAGWVTTYEKWRYVKKGEIPELKHYLDKEDNINDMHFIEIENKYDCSSWLYDYIIENDETITGKADIVYWFDN